MPRLLALLLTTTGFSNVLQLNAIFSDNTFRRLDTSRVVKKDQQQYAALKRLETSANCTWNLDISEYRT